MDERKEVRRIKRLDQGLFDLLGNSIIYIMQYSERYHIPPFLTDYQNMDSSKRRSELSELERKPECIIGIPKLKRKEVSCYKPSDLWTQEDDLLFLKWVTNKRDRCYHTMARDLSARPHEILNLKIKDVAFKNTANGYQYAEVLVNGKTGSRHIPLIQSIPYLKE